MSHARHSAGRPAVIQGSFQGHRPSLALQARSAGRPSWIGNAFQVPPAIDLSHAGPGLPLPAAVLQKMESFFGASFSDVRVHVGHQARAIGAVAFTMGSSLYFAPGHYSPDSPHGQRLLGHELAHVVQQRAGRVRNPFNAGVAVVQDQGLEAEAERKGLQAAAYRMPEPARPIQPSRAPRPAAPPAAPVVMRKVGFEYEIASIKTQKNTSYFLTSSSWVAHRKGEVLMQRTGYDITADKDQHGASQVEFILKEIDETNPAERRAIVRAAREVQDDVKALTATANVGNWVQANQIPRLNGSRWLRFQSEGNYLKTVGQLQMTGGVRIRKLTAILSGTALGEPDRRDRTRTFHAFAQQYSTHNQQDERRQVLFWAAVAAVRQEFGSWHPRHQYQLASVITMIATIPLTTRDLMPREQGLLQARTDYSKILLELRNDLGRDIPVQGFLNAVMRTINSQSRGARVSSADSVFPTPQVGGQDLRALTIGDWVRAMVPTPGRWWGQWQGRDLLTEQHFPGTPAEKEEVRSYGGFGSRTDPGDKLILEWRNLNFSHPDDLPMIVKGLVNYLRRANE